MADDATRRAHRRLISLSVPVALGILLSCLWVVPALAAWYMSVKAERQRLGLDALSPIPFDHYARQMTLAVGYCLALAWIGWTGIIMQWRWRVERGRHGVRMALAAVVGVALLSPSALFGVLLLEEWRLHSLSTAAFDVKPLSERTLSIGSTSVTITDTADLTLVAAGVEVDAPVTVRVNGRPMPVPFPARVRGTGPTVDRYGRDVRAFLVEQRSDGRRRLAIAQNITGRRGDQGGLTGTVCYILWIDEDGSMRAELAYEQDLMRNPLATRLMEYVSPHTLGYRTNVGSIGWVLPAYAVYGVGLLGALCLLLVSRAVPMHPRG